MEYKVFTCLPRDAAAVRTAVFVEEQGFCNEFDEQDDSALHLVAYDASGAPAGVCRILEGEGHAFTIGRVAVKKEFRGRGIGEAVMKEAERVILEKGGDAVILHAQCRAKDFYHRLGYLAYGDVEEDEGCPHVWMKKSLRRL